MAEVRVDSLEVGDNDANDASAVRIVDKIAASRYLLVDIWVFSIKIKVI